MRALPLSSKIYLLKPDDVIFLSTPEGTYKHKIRLIRKHSRYAIVAFQDIKDPDTARRFRGAVIEVDSEAITLGEGEYLVDQIKGLSVITEDGDDIGTVTGILETGSNDVYVVQKSDKEYLIPAIRDVIKKIDIEKGRITIKIMEGMLD